MKIIENSVVCDINSSKLRVLFQNEVLKKGKNYMQIAHIQIVLHIVTTQYYTNNK